MIYPFGPRLNRIALAWLVALTVFAEDKKEAKPPEPPNPLLTVPLGLLAGATNALVLRGQRLKDATHVVLAGLSEPVVATIKRRDETKAPDGLTVERAGDQLLELELVLPSSAAGHTNLAWIVSGPSGTGRPLPTAAFALTDLSEAKKPNSSFHDAPQFTPGQRVRGVLADPGDVAVFQLEGTVGQTVRAEITASRLSSTLDAILTLYDAKGTILASNDDTFGRDPAVNHLLVATGRVFVAVTYANEKAAKTHGYLLRVEVDP